MAQGIAKKERALKAQLRKAVTPGQPQIQEQGFLILLLHHQPQVAGEQCTVCIALGTEQHGQPAQLRVRRDRRQAFTQAPYQTGHLAGTRTVGDKIPSPGAHGIEHQLVIHAIAQGNHGQHWLGLKQPLDHCALRHDFLSVQPDKNQTGESYVNQCQQLIQTARAYAHHLAQGRQCALQPLKISVVARQREKCLAQALAHWDSPLRVLNLPFSRKYRRYQLGS